jgi:beta-galactosidase GanA
VQKTYFDDPIVAAYLHILPRIATDEEIDKYLAAIKEARASSIWAFVFGTKKEKLEYFMNQAHNMSLKVVPVFQPFISIKEHPEVKIISADGSTSDDPRYFNIGCYNHPYLLEKTEELIKEFLEQFKDHPALYRIGGLPLFSFIHEAYYRTEVPEFGGGPLKPCCYCKYCVADFREKMKTKYGSIKKFNLKHKTSFEDWDSLEPPKEPSNPSLWKEWFDCHAEIIPNFLAKLIEYAKSITPVASTHELNDFYPCSYQCVYSGNDIYRMARVIDVGHEDMYPLEFDHRYVIYVYEYIKDLLRAAMGFNKLYTANGQSFNSWLGYKVPPASMSEQVYSCLVHGALGIVWWVDWNNLDLWAKTKQPNEEYGKLVSALRDYELSKAEVALVYPWTSMELKTDDTYNMNNALFYMALVRSGVPVDVISEQQVADGLLEKRGYKVVCSVGCPVFPPEVSAKIRRFVEKGGNLIQDYEGQGVNEFKSAYPELVAQPSAEHTIYTVKTDLPPMNELNGKIVPVANVCEKLSPSKKSAIIAEFDDGEPAVVLANVGKGAVVKAASLLGWDYSNYPGHYDFAAMFPFLIRRNENVRELILRLLKRADVQPPAESSNLDVEVGVWNGKDADIILAVNHLDKPSESALTVNLESNGAYIVQDYFTKEKVKAKQSNRRIAFTVNLSNFQGKAFLIKRS